jgi:hypothetical protein
VAPPSDEETKVQALIAKLETRIEELAGSEPASAAKMKGLVAGLKALEVSAEDASEGLSSLNRTIREASDSGRDFDRALKRSIKTFTGVTDASNTLMGSFVNMAKEQGSLAGALAKTKESFDKAVSGQKIGISVAQKLVEGTLLLAKANDSAMASFNGATGAGGSYNKQIIELEKENRKFGIGATESAAALKTLIGGLSGFGLMAKDTQSALADEVSELQKLGAAGADTTGVFQTATKTFGMTSAAAMNLNKQAETLAGQLGISVGQAVGDLNKALPQLAVLSGDQVSGAFKRLSEQAVETGLSIDNLTSIADKFMTFESASKAAGSLNAVLGTQMFDTMGLLEAQLEGPQAFIDKLRADLQASVGDFDSLNVYQKQSIANAAGMSVIDVRKLMNAKEISAEEKKQGESREKNLKATMDLMAELKAVGAELTVAFSPVIKGLKNVLSSIATMLKKFRELGETLGGGIGGGLGTVAGAGTLAVGGKLAAKGVSKVLGIGGKLGTKDNPMFVQDVNGAESKFFGEGGMEGKKDKLLKSIGDRLKKTKLGQKVTSELGIAKDTIKGLLPKGGGGGFLGGMKNMFKGAAKKYGPKSLAKLGGRLIPGVGTAMLAYDAMQLGRRFLNNGSDSTDGNPYVVGDDPGNPRAKPELVVPPPGSAVINNSILKAAVRQNTGGQANQEILAAIKAVASRPIQVNSTVEMDKRKFGKTVSGLINGHFDAPGSFKPA